MKKYELTNEKIRFNGKTLFRIRALTSFRDVSAGDLGGFIESEDNLSHKGNSWVYDTAKVYGDAMICDDAQIYDNAWICDDAMICDNAKICDNARICGSAFVEDYAIVQGTTEVSGETTVSGGADLESDADYMTICINGCDDICITACKDRKIGISVKTAGFLGSLSGFENAVKELYGDSIQASKFLALITVIKLHFATDEQKTA